MARIIISLIGIAFGTWCVWKSDWLVTNLGRIPWAEAHLSTDGGSKLMYKLIGLAAIFLSFLYRFGLIEGIILSILTPMFPKK